MTEATSDPDEVARQLAAESLTRNDATGWFEHLYAAAADGAAVVPWDRGAPHPLLIDWARMREARGDGRRAVVVGCGLGTDAEFIAGLGFDTVAFDVAASAVEAARRRHPDSVVRYATADLFELPASWAHAFDLVVENMTVQALPEPLHAAATGHVRSLVAPGGRLLVIASARDDGETVVGPPWPLTRSEVDAFAGDLLDPVRVQHLRDAHRPEVRRWRAEFVHRTPVPSDAVVLRTERMALRRFTEADVDDVFDLLDDPEVMHFLNGGRPASRERVRTETLPRLLGYQEPRKGVGWWAAIEQATGRFLGWFEFRPNDDDPATFELGYRLRRSAWGRGYATEGCRALINKGFDEFGAQRVVADTMAVNTRSRRVMEKLGLSVVRRFHTPWDGPDPIDGHEQGEVEYELRRAEWAARQA